MGLALLFVSVFVSVILLFGLFFLAGKAMMRFSEWIQKKTGNYNLATFGPSIVLTALCIAACITWIAAVSAHP